MRAASKDLAYFEALKYYQERLAEAEKRLSNLDAKIDDFVKAVRPQIFEPEHDW